MTGREVFVRAHSGVINRNKIEPEEQMKNKWSVTCTKRNESFLWKTRGGDQRNKKTNKNEHTKGSKGGTNTHRQTKNLGGCLKWWLPDEVPARAKTLFPAHGPPMFPRRSIVINDLRWVYYMYALVVYALSNAKSVRIYRACVMDWWLETFSLRAAVLDFFLIRYGKRARWFPSWIKFHYFKTVSNNIPPALSDKDWRGC